MKKIVKGLILVALPTVAAIIGIAQGFPPLVKGIYPLQERLNGRDHLAAEEFYSNGDFRNAYTSYEQSAQNNVLHISDAALAYFRYYGIGTIRDREAGTDLAADVIPKLIPYEGSRHLRPNLYLAILKMNGIGTPKDETAAKSILDNIEWSPWGKLFLAFMHLDEGGDFFDRSKGLEYLQKASELPLARIILAEEFLSDTSSDQKYSEAHDILRALTPESPYAKLVRGNNLAYGVGIEANPLMGLALIIRAHEEGNRSAARHAGYLIRNKLDVRFQDDAYKEWLDLAEQTGDPIVKANRAYETLAGNSNETDTAEALDVLSKAAQKDDSYAQALLGIAYLEGYIQNTDNAQSLVWLERAIENDNTLAMWALAVHLYSEGTHGDNNHKRAIKLLERAKLYGSNRAACDLAEIYHFGKVQDRDEEKALRILNEIRHTTDFCEPLLQARILESKAIEKDFDNIVGLYEDAAMRGSVFAQLRLAYIYYNGQLGQDNNYELSRQWLNRREVKNVPQRDYLFGEMYYLGTGVPKDVKKSVDYLERAAERGLSDAQYLLGTLLYQNSDVTSDLGDAQELLEAAELQQHSGAMNNLAALLRNKPNATRNELERARSLFDDAVDNGNSAALVSLASMYFNGEGGLPLYSEAFVLLERAANAGDTSAQRNLGCIYLNGLYGITKNRDEAIEWLEKAIKQGSVEAKATKAKILLDEKLGSRVDAITMMQEAASEGNNYARFRLGEEHLFGDPANRNEVLGLNYLFEAVDGGNSCAYNLLALMLEKGEILSEDPSKAAILYEKAASQGLAVAAFNFGRLLVWNESGKIRLDAPESWDFKLGVSNLEFAAKNQNAEAIWLLVELLDAGQYKAGDTLYRRRLVTDAAELGHPVAIEEIGPQSCGIAMIQPDLSFSIPTEPFNPTEVLGSVDFGQKDTVLE